MSDLSYEELERYIGEICAGKKLVYVEDGKGVQIPLLFRHASYRDKELSTFIYKRALKEAEEAELPTISEMETLIKERGLFSKVDQEKLEKLESKREGQRVILAKTTRVPAKRDRIKDIIENLDRAILELRLKKERLFDFTRERKSAEEKMLYLAWAGSLDPFSGNLYWRTYDDFKSEKDYVFRKRVFVEYTIYHYGVEQKTIRAIARSGLWRIRYTTALKTSESLFGRPIPDYTPDQLMLIYWSHYYQSIYEMLPDDRPPESIIEDDAALDAYMKDWMAEKSRGDTASRSKSKYGAPTAWDYNETLVMRSNDVFEDVDYSKTLKEKGSKAETAQDAAPMTRGKKR
jgi:hypothetical protein